MNKQGKLLCIKKCDNCGNDVEIRHKNRLDRKNVFCSKKCEMESKKRIKLENKNYFNCECPICKKKFHLKPSALKKSKNHYCSIDCHKKAKEEYMKGANNHQFGLKGDKNSSWKSDRKITNYGYVKIRNLEHPFKDCDGFVLEHRLIAEKYLLDDKNSIEINGKRYLKEEYVVHHIDMNRKNNELSNLKVMTLKEHTSFHSKSRRNKNDIEIERKGSIGSTGK